MYLLFAECALRSEGSVRGWLSIASTRVARMKVASRILSSTLNIIGLQEEINQIAFHLTVVTPNNYTPLIQKLPLQLKTVREIVPTSQHFQS